ncbi:hypothetical protein J7I10_004447 [Vibrio vulnificus]|nr:hypothetical protein [Vibrio vulnificus]EHH0747237.1 hypothetical protein [Vibrio vulnificus]
MKFFPVIFALLLIGCTEEKTEVHDSLIALSNEVTKVEIARASEVALKTRRPENVVQAFVLTSAFLLGKSDTPEAQCISKSIGLSSGPAAMIEIASKAFVVGSSAFDEAHSAGRQYKSLDKLIDELESGTSDPSWLDDYQIEKSVVLEAVGSMYGDNGEHVLNDWLVCTKD